MSGVTSRAFAPPPFCAREALRYAGVRDSHETTERLLYECFHEVEEILSYRVCWREMPIDQVPFLPTEIRTAVFGGCERVVLFGATLGVELDRRIAKYGHTSPSKALLLQAIGTERIEALCDAFCRTYARENGVFLTRRFSPGYGDLPLEIQRDVFAWLDCSRQIGLTLTERCVMSPSKSVTAFVGITDREINTAHTKCAQCDNADCLYRSQV